MEAARKDLTVYQELGAKTNSADFQRWLNAGLLNDIDETFVTETQKYWENNYGKTVDPSLHLAYMNYTGKKDTRVIPGKIMRKEILPVFNDYDISTFYKDKNLYEILINPPRSAETILRNIDGTYFDSNNDSIDIISASQILLNSHKDLIIKPSRSNNGNGIRKLTVQDENIYLDGKTVTIHHLEEMYEKNFMVQKAIQQHTSMAAPHPASVNTLRMVTFRWKNEIRYLLAFARFGSNNDIRDNAGAHSGVDVRLGVTDSGEFFNLAVSQYGQTYTHHPTTGYCFADLEPIPNFDEYKRFVKDCHKNIFHLNLISWDIAIDYDGKPIFIEANFAGTTNFYQIAAQKPMFGDLTDEVLEYVKNELRTNKPKLMKKDRQKLEQKIEQKKLKKQQMQIQKLKQMQKENVDLKKQNQKLKSSLEKKNNKLITRKNELEAEKEKYKKIVHSKSWRYTQPFRYLRKSIKKIIDVGT
ncbi:sugar-transfer associated ATP-grasp domain-containing protein [Salicibibacter kimchii]|nr:sugar-transfer associated ATP-grasp domain-containing protein [Salicibibacter kimchii]